MSGSNSSNKISEKSFKDYSYTSRYSPFPYYYNKEDNKYFYGLTAYLDDNTPYIIHTVEEGDNLDNIALQYYNNPTYYWIICSFNHITNPFKSLSKGQTLKIPSMSSLMYDVAGRF
jgi:hypothetical protein